MSGVWAARLQHAVYPFAASYRVCVDDLNRLIFVELIENVSHDKDHVYRTFINLVGTHS